MNRFAKVVGILDNAVGGPSAPVSFHGAFWRGVDRNTFVAKVIFGLPLITVGDGAGSTIIKALKGETPFGADTGNGEADYNRMPSGLPPVSSVDIAFIETWINEGCLEDPVVDVAPLSWRKTNAPVASSRTDDIWFINSNTGWAVNSDGKIIKTTDGGLTWQVQKTLPGVYLRSVGFADADVGWVGTLTANRRLFHTTDGGTTWSEVANLPANAPIAVCGLSVVSNQVVFCSGTNRPTDSPRMMKTVDGGANWTAWDMSAHASILIDTYFTDALHGWVVGGKANEPTPTTRDKLKPVVLETSDGGVTWTNRLGDMGEFPFGEWGWKIHFLNADPQIGFVSLENFTAGAILKTTDGGQTWRRLKVNDSQRNANLEGIGFIDENRGWVGGWGSADFTKGYTSATVDGGANWTDANDTGKFLNRFRFLGSPVTLGYASGDTIYKYSSEPAPPAPAAITASAGNREILPNKSLTGCPGSVPIAIDVRKDTKRLSIYAWNRFGEEVGCILDELNPSAGLRTFVWDARDRGANLVSPGDYIVRAVADDVTASSLLHVQAEKPVAGLAGELVHRPRMPQALPTRARLTTISELVRAPAHDIAWLRNALQIAVQLELFTLPPYLTARWTIKNQSDPVAKSIKEIRGEEMLHFGLASNMLAAIDGAPLVADDTVVPKFPSELPGGVRPGLSVALRKLDVQQAEVFMDIEYPQGGPIAALVAPPVTIGEFYAAILQAFQDLNPALSTTRQLDGPLGLFKVDSPTKVQEAIELIKVQGEGSNRTPEEKPGDLAHYYRFGEIAQGRKFELGPDGKWGYGQTPVLMPNVYPMADIPAGGYQQADVPDPAVWDLIDRFDLAYSEMLVLLQDAWTNGDPAKLSDAVSKMINMGTIGRQLVTKPRPDGVSNYGPCFRFVPS